MKPHNIGDVKIDKRAQRERFKKKKIRKNWGGWVSVENNLKNLHYIFGEYVVKKREKLFSFHGRVEVVCPTQFVSFVTLPQESFM